MARHWSWRAPTSNFLSFEKKGEQRGRTQDERTNERANERANETPLHLDTLDSIQNDHSDTPYCQIPYLARPSFDKLKLINTAQYGNIR